MKSMLVLSIATLAFSFGAYAQEKKNAPTAQQQLMATCNKEAEGMKGDERKKKMSACLSDGRKRQQEKMKMCAAENKGKKGEEYKTAQAECLKK